MTIYLHRKMYLSYIILCLDDTITSCYITVSQCLMIVKTDFFLRNQVDLSILATAYVVCQVNYIASVHTLLYIIYPII